MLSVSLSQYNDPVHLGRSGMQRHMPYELHQKQPTTTASTTNHVLCSKSTTLQTMFQDTSWVILPFPGNLQRLHTGGIRKSMLVSDMTQICALRSSAFSATVQGSDIGT